MVGQAPGAKVHASGVPWGDRSGERLRNWMGIDTETFYDKDRVALVPMGYCYPGRAARDWHAHAPRVIPLPHPSPRNVAWFKANPWFDHELVPVLRHSVQKLVGG